MKRDAFIASAGVPRAGIYWRSAAKPFQAMALLEAGGETAFRLGSDEIALICASHGGEPRHVAVARRLLERGGFRPKDLACGAHLPMHEPSARALIVAGRRPTALHNNCSGKHGGVLLACRLHGFDAEGYWTPDHPIQRIIKNRLATFCGIPAPRIGIAVDGCSLPVFHTPLWRLAFAYARLVAPARKNEPVDPQVRRRICRAMWESPGMVAGRRPIHDSLPRGGARPLDRQGGRRGGLRDRDLLPPGGEGARHRVQARRRLRPGPGRGRARHPVATRPAGRFAPPGPGLVSLPRRAQRARGLHVGRIVAEVPLENL